jgi:adenosine kinase
MNLVLTGSIAYDYLMSFPGYFRDHILPDQLDRLSLSFLVDSMTRRRGGAAANIAYTLALLGEHPKIMATLGEDGEEYCSWLENHGVDTTSLKIIEGESTASFFVNTDQSNAQIASFYSGAMNKAGELHFNDLPDIPDLAVISPNEPHAMVQYVKECRKLSIPYLYDPSQQIVRLDASNIIEGIEGCLALVVNDYELGLIVEKTGIDLETISQYATFIIITRGEFGVDLYSGDDFLTISAIQPKTIVDPTGAGDAFRGGFLKGYLHGLTLERCGQFGVLAATFCLESLGPQGQHYDLPAFVQRFRENFDDEGELDQLQ